MAIENLKMQLILTLLNFQHSPLAIYSRKKVASEGDNSTPTPPTLVVTSNLVGVTCG